MSTAPAVAEIRRRLPATPERVFAAFADPALVALWLKPAPEIRLVVLDFDLRVGGRYRFAYHLPDGAVVTIGGAFHAVEPPTGLVFSWVIEPPDEHAGMVSEVTVSILPDRGGAELLVRHTRLDRPGAVARHSQGWLGAFDLLTTLLSQPETAS